jgi:hypothetical protein
LILYVSGSTGQLFTCTNGAYALQSPVAGAASGAVPSQLRFLGDGSDGAITCSGNISGPKYATTFTIANGATCTSNVVNTPVTIYATGACTIAGTLNARGIDGGSLSVGAVDYGGGGGGGGGGAAAGAVGISAAITNFAVSTGGPGGALGGNVGIAAVALNANIARYAWNSATGWYHGGGVGGAGGSAGGAGGKGGQGIVLTCASINFTGAINVSGAPGGDSTGNSIGAGGGGGGGYVWLIGRDSVVNAGVITATGGAGGGCGAFTTCGIGGKGADGWSKAAQMQ